MNRTPAGLSGLLTGLIDYAGMFPPARLPLEDALSTYLGDLRSQDAWMLASFVLPTRRMADAAALLENADLPSAPVFSALGRGGESRTAFLDGLAADIAAVKSFRNGLPGRVLVKTLETRLPAKELDFQIRADALVEESAGIAAGAGLLPYFEAPFDDRWEELAGRTIQAIRRAPFPARFKIRTGGVVPEAFPSPQRLAWGMLEAAAHGVAYKCTAGLHHPIRHFDPETGAMMHGFINVFAGAILAGVHDMGVDMLASILSEEDPGAFQMDDLGLGWRSFRASNEQISNYRRELAVSIGSCSFDEPRADIKAIGWMA